MLGADADLLQAAAWLHDIGYAPVLATTAFTPGRRPVPTRHPARRHHAVPARRPPLLRHDRSRGARA
ncbi:MAG TPA: hypothetical protein VHO07_31605 [Streptosporangiaceae bacterium]|nr:hypothetical protein [Streptosporangiaceae bacterium]